MGTIIYESEETFELFDFMDGHRVLTLRARAGYLSKYNHVEIEFLDVFYLNIPSLLPGICLCKMSDDEIQQPMLSHKKSVHDNFFSIESGGKQFVIGALSVSAYFTKASGALSTVRDSSITMSDIEIIATSLNVR